jgi:hypothetical protein
VPGTIWNRSAGATKLLAPEGKTAEEARTAAPPLERSFAMTSGLRPAKRICLNVETIRDLADLALNLVYLTLSGYHQVNW